MKIEQKGCGGCGTHLAIRMRRARIRDSAGRTIGFTWLCSDCWHYCVEDSGNFLAFADSPEARQ